MAQWSILSVAVKRATNKVGASGAGGMAGMKMGPAARVHLAMRDIDGRSISLPGGRPGIILFVQARNCPACVVGARNAADARRAAGGTGALTIVAVDSTTSRDDFGTFARAAGEPSARYVVDDRMGTITSTLQVSDIDTAIVYDARGRLVARASVGRALLRSELRLAAGR